MLTSTFLNSIFYDPDLAKLDQAAETIRFLVLLILGAAMLAGALALGARIYFRTAIRRYDAVVENRSGTLQFFIGAINSLIVLFLVALLSKLGPFAIFAFVLLFFVSIMVLFGLAARLREIGTSILALGNGDITELRACLVGGGLLIAVFFIPFVGQIFWIGLLVQCFGTALLRLFSRPGTAPEPDPTAPVRFEI
jgi:hypothetical protein